MRSRVGHVGAVPLQALRFDLVVEAIEGRKDLPEPPQVAAARVRHACRQHAQGESSWNSGEMIASRTLRPSISYERWNAMRGSGLVYLRNGLLRETQMPQNNRDPKTNRSWPTSFGTTARLRERGQ